MKKSMMTLGILAIALLAIVPAVNASKDFYTLFAHAQSDSEADLAKYISFTKETITDQDIEWARGRVAESKAKCEQMPAMCKFVEVDEQALQKLINLKGSYSEEGQIAASGRKNSALMQLWNFIKGLFGWG